MKLQAEFEKVLRMAEDFIAEVGMDRVREYVQQVKDGGSYRDFDVRIANDIVKYGAMYRTMKPAGVCDMLARYGADDSHLTTLCVKVAKELNLI